MKLHEIIHEFKSKGHLTNKQIRELQNYGRKIDVKVTKAHVGIWPVVHIRDLEFKDFTRAALCLRHIEQAELPDSHLFLVG